MASTSIQLGGLTDETRTCFADFANEHEHYVDNLILTTPERLEALDGQEIAELARDGGLWLDCMTEDELRRWQELIAAANLAGS